MTEEMGAVAPRTTWEFCLSAADELTRRQAPDDAERRALVVVLLAAVLAGCADAADLHGAQVAEVPLDAAGGALGLLQSGARPAVRSCSAPPGLGGEQLQMLLDMDRAEFAMVRALAEKVLTAHLADAAGGRVSTVREAAVAAQRARTLQGIAEALGMDEEG